MSRDPKAPASPSARDHETQRKLEPATHDSPRPKQGGSTWLSTLRTVIAAVEASDAHEVEVQTADLRIRLRRSLDHVQTPSTHGERAEADSEGLHTVRCPLTGVWYDAPAPGAAPFVRPGDFVTIGAVIGLLETMKVFNEVHADVAGIVRQVLARRGELVMAHAPLITVEPAGITAIEGLA